MTRLIPLHAAPLGATVETESGTRATLLYANECRARVRLAERETDWSPNTTVRVVAAGAPSHGGVRGASPFHEE